MKINTDPTKPYRLNTVTGEIEPVIGSDPGDPFHGVSQSNTQPNNQLPPSLTNDKITLFFVDKKTKKKLVDWGYLKQMFGGSKPVEKSKRERRRPESSSPRKPIDLKPQRIKRK